MTERIKYIHVQRSFRFPVSETTQGVSETMRRRNDRSPTPLMRLKVAPKQRISLHAATYCRERTGKSGLDKLEYGQNSNTKQGGWARLFVSNEQTNRIAVVSLDGVSPGLESIRPITYNNLQHGAHTQQRCYFRYVWIPHVQTLSFHVSSQLFSGLKNDNYKSGE